MFKSIRWRFVYIYFTLILVALIILGLFMVRRLETTQLSNMKVDIEQTVNTMLASSDSFSDPNWIKRQENIRSTLKNWNINSNYQMYAIYNVKAPTIVATVNVNSHVIGTNAYSIKNMEPELILQGFNNKSSQRIIRNPGDSTSFMHSSYPIVDTNGDVNGMFYVVSDLDNINELIRSTRDIFVKALGISFVVTLVLGLIMAGSITKPIIEMTAGVEIMAKGNYDQKVEVYSDDEVGQLAKTFNFLTSELNKTLSNMKLERGKLDTIFEFMQEGVIALDTNNLVIHANKVASEMLDLNRERQYINLRELNVFGIDYENKDTLVGESSVRIKGRYYNVLYGPYQDSKEYPSGIILVFQDVTKEHKLDETRKDFIANVSHELKTPLTTIRTYLETILLNQDLDSDTKTRFMNTVQKEVDRMTFLVQDLLELSNIDYESTTFDLEEFRISDFLEGVINSLETLRLEKNIRIKVVNEDKDIRVINERKSLEKIFMNILSNAYKYSGANSTVNLTVNNLEDKFKIAIEDQGEGIPYSDQKHIFDRFYRVEKGRSRASGGTGLGLSIVKELVEAQGGTILLTSVPGVGTKITVTLPKEVKNK